MGMSGHFIEKEKLTTSALFHSENIANVFEQR